MEQSGAREQSLKQRERAQKRETASGLFWFFLFQSGLMAFIKHTRTDSLSGWHDSLTMLLMLRSGAIGKNASNKSITHKPHMKLVNNTKVGCSKSRQTQEWMFLLGKFTAFAVIVSFKKKMLHFHSFCQDVQSHRDFSAFLSDVMLSIWCAVINL